MDEKPKKRGRKPKHKASIHCGTRDLTPNYILSAMLQEVDAIEGVLIATMPKDGSLPVLVSWSKLNAAQLAFMCKNIELEIAAMLNGEYSED